MPLLQGRQGHCTASGHLVCAYAHKRLPLSGPMFGKECLYLSERLVAGDRVALLNQAAEFLLMPLNGQQLVFGQFAPGHLCGTNVLLPSALEFRGTGWRPGARNAPSRTFGFVAFVGAVHGNLAMNRSRAAQPASVR